MKFAGQTNRNTYGKSYAHPLSEVDGPANYLGIAGRQEHIQNRRGMGLYRNSSLSQLLPAKAEYEFLAREDICALDQIMAKLSLLLTDAMPEEKHKIQLKQKKAYSEKRSLYNEELRKLQSQSGRQHGSIYTETMFYYRRKVMPHRDLLASTLPCNLSLRSLDGRRTMQALESLCSETDPISYLDSLSPIGQACLCGRFIEEYVIRQCENMVSISLT
jgi:carbonic anhydrase